MHYKGNAMRLKYLAWALCATGTPLLAAAADDGTRLPDIDVTAVQPHTAHSTSDIRADEIARQQPADLKQLLQHQTGVAVSQVQRTRQGNDSVNIRGLSGNRVSLSIDGIALPEAQESRIFASAGLVFGRGNFIEPTALRSASISRAAEAEGLAGAVRFSTLEPADLLQQRSWGGYLQGSYHSADHSYSSSAGIAGAAGAWQGLLMGTYRHGHETETRGEVGGSGATRTEADPQDHNSRYFLSKHHFRLNDRHRLSLTGEYLRRHQWLSQLSQLNANHQSDRTHDRNTRSRVSLGHRYRNEDAVLSQIDTQIYWQDSRTDNLRQRNGSRGSRTDTGLYRDTVWGLSSEAVSSHSNDTLDQTWRYGLKLARHQLRYDVAQVPAASGRFVPQHLPADDTVRTTAALYGEGSLDFGRWLLLPGLRADYYRLAPEQAAGQSRFALSPRIGVVWQLHPLFQPYAGYARGFHAPSAQQLSSSWGMSGFYSIIGNSQLQPETAHNFEIGARGQNETLTYQVALYDNRYKNFIDYRTAQTYIPGRQTWRIQYQNFDRARIYGVEANARWRFAPHWHLGGGLAFARGYTRNGNDVAGSGDNNQGKQPINSILPLKLRLGLAYEQERWGAGLQLTRINGKSDSQISGEMYNPTRPVTLVDIGGHWQPTKQLRLSAGVNNLFNRKYWDWGDISYLAARSAYSGSFDHSLGSSVPGTFNATNADAFSAPGRHFTVTLRYEF